MDHNFHDGARECLMSNLSVCVCVDHLKRCKTCNKSWAGPLPIAFTIPLVWFYCETKTGQDPYPVREPFPWSGSTL